MPDLFKRSFDEFSDDRRYRFVMGHVWDDDLPKLVSLALNPSVGDASQNDATNERLERRAVAMGLGGVIFVNLFPVVAKDPRDMKRAADPFGDRGRADSVILEQAAGNFLLCGWGTHGRHRQRDIEVIEMLHAAGVRLHVLLLNSDGTPRHPLYVSYDTGPVVWDAPLRKTAKGPLPDKRTLMMVETYNASPRNSLRVVASMFGVTPQRVHKVLLKHSPGTIREPYVNHGNRPAALALERVH